VACDPKQGLITLETFINENAYHLVILVYTLEKRFKRCTSIHSVIAFFLDVTIKKSEV
jgi:hypothetical protein